MWGMLGYSMFKDPNSICRSDKGFDEGPLIYLHPRKNEIYFSSQMGPFSNYV